ncbi:MAG: DUF2807 domain-containing protein [Candidatus Obscuribacterales bacterium]|nr:DUF2807 domain-containing protein [Steroidobacteraceae bacterium]
MHKSSVTLIALAAAAMLVAGCERSPRMEVESRDLGNFEAIDFHGAAEVKITVGEPAALSIEGSQRALKAIDTSVRDNVLYLRAEKSGWSFIGDQQKLKLSISMPKLTSFDSSGAGSVRITGLAGGEHLVRVAGAHNIEAEGTLDNLQIKLDGAGNIDYGKVVTQNAKVTVNGAGNVEVHPIVLLDARVNGVGAVHFVGEPQKVESAIHGLGAIKRK